MRIDLSRLKNIEHKSDGKTVAQCPACAAAGSDTRGEHLVIFPDRSFGCVAHPKDKSHNRKILSLVGLQTASDGCRLTINRIQIPESAVLLRIGQIGQPFVSPGTGGTE